MSDQELFTSIGAVRLDGIDHRESWYFGWTAMQPQISAYLRNEDLRFFADSGEHLTGTGAGKTVLLYEAVRRVWGGRDLDVGPQKVGDCVGWAFAGCVDLIACLEVIAGETETHSWELRTSTEALYALSRVEYGDFDGKYNSGSYGRWAARAVQEGGTLARQKLGELYPAEGGDYRWQRALSWGAAGLPDELEPAAREHRIRQTSLIRSFEEARDAIANGYPVAVGSSQGFSLERDAEGFARPVGTWFHCMKFVASRDDARPGLLCLNSIGAAAHTGEKGEFDIPDGSFWVDAEICTKMFRESLDSYCLSQFDGYPRQIENFTSFIG